MKKVAIIVQSLKGGGAERTAANMSIDLSSKFDVHLIVFDTEDISYKYGGTLHSLNMPPRDGYLNKLLQIRKRCAAVKRLKKEHAFDCCISLMEGANFVNVLTKKNERIIVSERNLISYFVKGGLHKAMTKYIHRKADAVVSLSEVVRRDLIKCFGDNPEKVVTIYNSVDVSKFSLPEAEPMVEKPYIVTMGRLTSQKAQWHIIRAFSKVASANPQYKLVLLGDGELRKQLEELTQTLGISDKVVFMGYQKNPHAIVKNAEFFVFSSVVEGLGSVLLEALACGKAIISSDCDAGPREILAPSTDIEKKTDVIEYGDYGILVPVESDNNFSPQASLLTEKENILSSAIETLINNIPLRHKYEDNAKVRINDFSPEKITEEWETLILNLVDGK